jgi:hypothetical protein
MMAGMYRGEAQDQLMNYNGLTSCEQARLSATHNTKCVLIAGTVPTHA